MDAAHPATASIAINPSLYGKVAFDPVNDFAPINTVGNTTFMLVVHPSFPAKSVRELVAVAKARPGQLTYSSAGNGSVAHLAGEFFKSMTATRVVHVPLRGNPPSMIALMSGEVDYTFGTLPATVPHVKSKKLRALAVSSAKRSVFVPTVIYVSERSAGGRFREEEHTLRLDGGLHAAIPTPTVADMKFTTRDGRPQ